MSNRAGYVLELAEEYLAVPWADAACADTPPATWFPDFTGARAEELARTLAAAYCDGCVIFRECREWSLRHESEGIWAGLTARARHAIRKGR